MLVLSSSVIPDLSESLHFLHCFENVFLLHCTRGELLQGEDRGLFCKGQPSPEHCTQRVLCENCGNEERTGTSVHWQPSFLAVVGAPRAYTLHYRDLLGL